MSNLATIQPNRINLAANFNFTGTLQQNGNNVLTSTSGVLLAPDYLLAGIADMLDSIYPSKTHFNADKTQVAIIANGKVFNVEKGPRDNFYFIYKSSIIAIFDINMATSKGQDSSVLYLLGKTNAASSFTRSDFDGQNASVLTISGSAPSSYLGGHCWDWTNDYFLVLDGISSTQIRRYTLSGTTITNINSDITLSEAPNNARAMWIKGTDIYILDQDDNSHQELRKYNASGTLLDKNLIQHINGGSIHVLVDNNVNYWISWSNNASSTGAGETAGYFYDIQL